MTLARLLILDDLTGWSIEERRIMCRNLVLASVTGGDQVEDESRYLAEAVFHPAQTRRGNEIVNDVEAALQAVAEGWDSTPEHRWALVLLDLQFDYGQVKDGPLDPDTNWPDRGDREYGLRILEAMARRWPDPERPGRTDVPVVALSARPRADLEGALNNLGNLSYLERERSGRPVTAEELRRQLADHIFHFGLIEDGPLPIVDARGRLIRVRRDACIIGKSLPLLRALRKARQAARTDGPCLLLGAPGSGKELFARYIHDLSPRATNTFRPVNCAAMPDTLIESELFGYAPNSGFANADRRGKPGHFEQADGGTIFLDEIGDMSGPSQAKVLRVLQDGEVQRLSATTSRKVDVRGIAATNKDLHAAVRDGLFREDLLGRLEGFVIHIPPLRERTEDIKLLFDLFLSRETMKLKGSLKRHIDTKVYQVLQVRHWANNVRELENLSREVASKRLYSEQITPSDIPIELAKVHEGIAEFDQRPAVEVAVPSSDPSITVGVPTLGIAEVAMALRAAQVPKSLTALQGKLALVQDAYGYLAMRMLEAALEEAKDMAGEIIPTTAVKRLLGRSDMTAAEAASEILRLAKFFPETPIPDSDLGRALTWAENRRRSGGRRRTGDGGEK